jgi:hypothetical protein
MRGFYVKINSTFKPSNILVSIFRTLVLPCWALKFTLYIKSRKNKDRKLDMSSDHLAEKFTFTWRSPNSECLHLCQDESVRRGPKRL